MSTAGASSASSASAASSSASSVTSSRTIASVLLSGEQLLPKKPTISAPLSYFRPFKCNRVGQIQKQPTHICELCFEVVRLVGNGATSNALSHLKHKHKRLDFGNLPMFGTKPSINAAFAAMRAAAPASKLDDESSEAASRRAFREKVDFLSDEQRALVDDKLQRLIIGHRLPYSSTEWPALRDLVETCLLLPSSKVSSDRYSRPLEWPLR